MKTPQSLILSSFLLVILSVFLSGSTSPADPADLILGTFWAPDKDGKIEMYKKGDTYWGKLTWGDKMDLKDTENPDPSLRSRKLLGIDIFMNFEYDREEKEWVNGRIYNSSDGNLYKAELWYEDGDTETLMVRGYLGLPVFGVTKEFERIE